MPKPIEELEILLLGIVQSVRTDELDDAAELLEEVKREISSPNDDVYKEVVRCLARVCVLVDQKTDNKDEALELLSNIFGCAVVAKRGRSEVNRRPDYDNRQVVMTDLLKEARIPELSKALFRHLVESTEDWSEKDVSKRECVKRLLESGIKSRQWPAVQVIISEKSEHLDKKTTADLLNQMIDVDAASRGTDAQVPDCYTDLLVKLGKDELTWVVSDAVPSPLDESKNKSPPCFLGLLRAFDKCGRKDLLNTVPPEDRHSVILRGYKEKSITAGDYAEALVKYDCLSSAFPLSPEVLNLIPNVIRNCSMEEGLDHARKMLEGYIEHEKKMKGDKHALMAASRMSEGIVCAMNYLDYLKHSSSASSELPVPRRPSIGGFSLGVLYQVLCHRELMDAMSAIERNPLLKTLHDQIYVPRMSEVISKLSPTLTETLDKFKNSEITADQFVRSVIDNNQLLELFEMASRGHKDRLYLFLDAVLEQKSCSTKESSCFMLKVFEKYIEHLKKEQEKRSAVYRFVDEHGCLNVSFSSKTMAAEEVVGCLRKFIEGESEFLSLEIFPNDQAKRSRHGPKVLGAMEEGKFLKMMDTLRVLRDRSFVEPRSTSYAKLFRASNDFKTNRGALAVSGNEVDAEAAARAEEQQSAATTRLVH